MAGFSNNIVIMIAGLFVVGAGIFRTGLAEMAGRMVVKWAKGSETKFLVMLMLLVAVLSAFMSDTGTVAVLIPVIMSVAASMKLSPPKFPMPVTFASNFGGVLTLIGTPPNLIASQTLAEYGYDRLAFFDFTPLGMIFGFLINITSMRFILTENTEINLYVRVQGRYRKSRYRDKTR